MIALHLPAMPCTPATHVTPPTTRYPCGWPRKLAPPGVPLSTRQCRVHRPLLTALGPDPAARDWNCYTRERPGGTHAIISHAILYLRPACTSSAARFLQMLHGFQVHLKDKPLLNPLHGALALSPADLIYSTARVRAVEVAAEVRYACAHTHTPCCHAGPWASTAWWRHTHDM